MLTRLKELAAYEYFKAAVVVMGLPTYEAVETNSMTRLNKILRRFSAMGVYYPSTTGLLRHITIYSRPLVSRIKCNYIINIPR